MYVHILSEGKYFLCRLKRDGERPFMSLTAYHEGKVRPVGKSEWCPICRHVADPEWCPGCEKRE